MEALKLIPSIVLILAISGIILGAAVITNVEFGDTMTQCWNTSYTINAVSDGCINSTANMGSIGKDGLNLTDEYYSMVKSQEGLTSVSEQQPTLAIIAVMVVIISVIGGVFAYFRMFR